MREGGGGLEFGALENVLGKCILAVLVYLGTVFRDYLLVLVAPSCHGPYTTLLCPAVQPSPSEGVITGVGGMSRLQFVAVDA